MLQSIKQVTGIAFISFLVMTTASSVNRRDCIQLTIMESLVERNGMLWTRAQFYEENNDSAVQGNVYLSISSTTSDSHLKLSTENELCSRNRTGFFIGILNVTTSWLEVLKESSSEFARVEITMLPNVTLGVLYGEDDFLINCRNMTTCMQVDHPRINFEWNAWSRMGSSPMALEFWNTWNRGLMPNIVRSLSVNLFNYTIPVDYILNLKSKSLNRLQISGNNWENEGDKLALFFKQLESQLPSLKQLSLPNNRIVEVPTGKYIERYQNFSSLQSLDFSYNKLKQIPYGLHYFPLIKNLNFTNQVNSVFFVPSTAEEILLKINRLCLRNTKYRVEEKVRELLECTIYKCKENIEAMSSYNRDKRYILLNGTTIHSPSRTEMPFAGLTVINLTDYNLKFYRSRSGKVVVYHLDLSHNQIEEFPKTANDSRVNIYASEKFQTVRIILYDGVVYLHKLDLSYLNISVDVLVDIEYRRDDIAPLESIIRDLQVPPYERLGDISVIIFPVSTVIMIHLTEISVKDIHILNLESNNIHSLNSESFQEFKELEELNLSHNCIHFIDNSVVLHLEGLRGVNLSFNSIREFYVKFQSNLTYLDLSNNNISGVVLTVSVEFLNLSYNKVSKLSNPQSTILNLSYNSLESISKELWENFQRVAILDLGGNDFQCCGDENEFTDTALLELVQTVKNLGTKESFTCYLSEDSPSVPIEETWLNRSLCVADVLIPHVYYQDILKVWLPLLVFICFLVAFMAHVYWYRAELAFLHHLHIMKQQGLTEDDMYATLCRFDAFICHSSADYRWVRKQLIPNIEGGDEEYRLCVHCREFALGSLIDENIQTALDESRKVIFILTRNFLSSVWCQFELDLARRKMIIENRDYIIIIELERLCRNELSRSLQLLMETRTYLEWPEDGSDLETISWCWRRLRDALGKSLYQRNMGCNETVL